MLAELLCSVEAVSALNTYVYPHKSGSNPD